MSVTHSLVQRITTAISGRSAQSSGTYTPSDYLYDYAIGGVAFLSATSDPRPDQESPVEQRKQQFDNQQNPGEYSLNQWWLRSQSIFSGGAGITYQDPDTQNPNSNNTRFAQSLGVDPFTDPDNIQLLKQTNADTDIVRASYGDTYLGTVTDSVTNVTDLWQAQGHIVRRTDPETNPSEIDTLTTYTLTSSSDASDSGIVGGIAIIPGQAPGDNDTAFVIQRDPTAANAGVWKCVGGVATRIYQMPVGSTPSTQVQMQIAYAHGFLVATYLNTVVVLDPAAAAGTVWPTPPVAQFPSGYVCTSIADGPDAIYFGVNTITGGAVYKNTFNETTGAINGVSQSAILPTGEQIHTIASYVNTYLVIATSSSIRIGQFTGSGVVYGPPILTITGGFRGIDFFGTRSYVGVEGTSPHGDSYGLIAVDLGTIIQDSNTGAQFNAYANWIYSTDALFPVTSVATTSTGRVIYGGQGRDNATISIVFVEHLTDLIESGFLDTGRCRFNTEEPKLFKYLSLRTPPLEGTVGVAVLDSGGGVTNYVTYGPTLDPGTNDVATPTPAGPQTWIALRFTLGRNALDATKGGRLDGWQIKALPGTLKQRTIIKNFLCFNVEKDKAGQIVGGDTFSLDRLTAVRQMCQRGDTVTFQDLANNISDQVIIDSYQFTMLAPPGPNKENYGGYLTLQLRTVADSVPPIQSIGEDEDDA